ncbi:MAG: methionyl-tRNA formyltransferase [Acidobacteria bacterium]|nr:methionyl-tRNA formyltransferase [Acidobacteriota bacterium]
MFFGTPSFAVPTLERLLDSTHAVVGIVTQPDRARGRGQKVTLAPVKALAVAREVPILQPERLSQADFAAAFASLRADLAVVAAYGKILPEWLLGAPRLGTINVHASLLPKYRGAAPIHRAIMAGETATGVTIMRIVKALDAGPMLARVVTSIGPDETSVEVERHLAALGADLLLESVGGLIRGGLTETPQNDSEATFAGRLTREDGLVDWTRPVRAVHDQVRGLHPWPHAFTFLDSARFILHRTRVGDHEPLASPGMVVHRGSSGLAVVCGDRRLLDVLEIQAEGRRVMPAHAFLAGYALEPGRRFR